MRRLNAGWVTKRRSAAWEKPLREGGCDLMLAFYDPDAAMQMDPEIFPSLHLGNTEMLPVCAADADGKPLFDLEGEGSVPLLAYSAGAFLGNVS
jgi:hypothetical protein